MKKIEILFCALLLSVVPASADELSDFTTDGCSLFPDGSPVNPNLWCDCCVTHDIAYWQGGTREARQQADEALRACVLQRTGKIGFAELVYAGVRAGGHPIFPNWYRWAYGWNYGRGYKPLTNDEEMEVKRKLEAFHRSHSATTCQGDRASGS